MMLAKLVTYNSQNYAGTLGSGLGAGGFLPVELGPGPSQLTS